MKNLGNPLAFTAIIAVIGLLNLTSCSNNETGSANQSQIDSLRKEIGQLTSENEAIANNLSKFDTLDYTVFSNQEWDRLKESHSKDIKVININ